jgi:hypothetical protein
MQWGYAREAAALAQEWDLPRDVRNFFMIQGSIEPQQPPWIGNVIEVGRFGPFINGPGGSVAAGPDAYIIYYRRRPRW